MEKQLLAVYARVREEGLEQDGCDNNEPGAVGLRLGWGARSSADVPAQAIRPACEATDGCT